MKSYLLRPKHRLYNVDHVFLAKAPLIPNRYLWEKKGYQMALFESEDDSLIICSDHEGFLNQYRSYYQERFDMSEMDFIPTNHSPIFGKLAAEEVLENASE